MKRQLIFLFSLLLFLAVACVNNQSGQEIQNEAGTEVNTQVSEDTSKLIPPPIYFTPFDHRYSGGGFYALVDGKYGNIDFIDEIWQGFNERDLDVAIDLGEEKHVTSVSANFLKKHEGHIFLPKSINIFASNDLKKFKAVGELIPGIPESMEDNEIVTLIIDNLDVRARYIRIKAISVGPVPAFVGADQGSSSWFFIDEIVID